MMTIFGYGLSILEPNRPTPKFVPGLHCPKCDQTKQKARPEERAFELFRMDLSRDLVVHAAAHTTHATTGRTTCST